MTFAANGDFSDLSLEWGVYCAVRTVCKHACVSEEVTFMVLLSEGQAGETLELGYKVTLFGGGGGGEIAFLRVSEVCAFPMLQRLFPYT
jgi:hypothetical protein